MKALEEENGRLKRMFAEPPPTGLARGSNQHLVPVFGNVDAYQNTGIRSMLNLCHGVLRTLCGVVRKITRET